MNNAVLTIFQSYLDGGSSEKEVMRSVEVDDAFFTKISVIV